MAAVAELDVFPFNTAVFEKDTLNDFIDLGKSITNKVRTDAQRWLQDDHSILAQKPHLFVAQTSARMHMPIAVGDYTDFYSSMEHATNVGKMFRDPENALLPNWKHIPVGYHGRASSVVVSGTDFHRPMGQILPKDAELPIYGPSQLLDFELEMGFITQGHSPLGKALDTATAQEHIFGMVLLNDWSARDIQKWEYVPLGPFLGKNFATHISPWVVTMEALAPFKVDGPPQEPKVLPYLSYKGPQNYDIHLEVALSPKEGQEDIICRSNYKYMYWNMPQQLAHHTVNGCNIRTGDLYGSGTISGKDPQSYGSMLELAWMGTRPLKLSDGSTRTFLRDGDTVRLRGHCGASDKRVGFGEVTATVLPAIQS